MSALLYMFGYFVIACATFWVSQIFLTSFFSVFNFEEEFIDFYKKRMGVPPSRKKLILYSYGAGSFFFLAEKCWTTPKYQKIRIIPTAFFLRVILLVLATIITVTSRKVIWLFLEQLRFQLVPVLHCLQGRLAAQG